MLFSRARHSMSSGSTELKRRSSGSAIFPEAAAQRLGQGCPQGPAGGGLALTPANRAAVSTRLGRTRRNHMELHRYRGRQDLARLLAFCSAATAARAPSRPPWHPGELAWELRGHFDEDRALYAVVRDGSVVGALSLQSENMIFDVLPRDASLLPRVLDAASRKRATPASAGWRPKRRTTIANARRRWQPPRSPALAPAGCFSSAI